MTSRLPGRLQSMSNPPMLCILVVGMGGLWRRESLGKGMLVYLILRHACLLNIEGHTCPFCWAQRWQPVDAVILSLQAVSTMSTSYLYYPDIPSLRLSTYSSPGERGNVISGTAHYFSPDNYGDRTLKEMKGLVRLQRRLWWLIPAPRGSSKPSRTSQTRTGLRCLRWNKPN